MKINLKSLAALACLAVFLFSCSEERGKLKTEIDTAIHIRMMQDSIPGIIENAMIPGFSIAVIRDGALFWKGAFGAKNMETMEAVTDSTIFEAASLSKPVFAYAVMRLVERGELNLDKPLIEYVSDQYVTEAFLNKPIDDERIRMTTARMVLTHSSGFPNWRRDNNLVINFEPGEKYSYSGEGFGYLQRVVEKITDLSLEEFMQKEVFSPLDMNYSSYVWQEKYEKLTSVPHDLMKQSLQKRRQERGHAAASLHTTASDFARFMLALVNFQGLTKSTIDSMLSPRIISRPDQSQNVTWGLGIGLEKTEHGTAFWHWGDNLNYRCIFIGFPKQKIGVIYFTNSYHGLAVRKKIVDLSIGGNHTLFNDGYLSNYGDAGKSDMRFIRIISDSGIDSALSYYRQIIADTSHANLVPEGSMNSIGYFYMDKKEYSTAIEIFKLNVQAYSEAWNVYDSLGEAYMQNGDRELAIVNYEKSLKINPENDNGTVMLERLKALNSKSEY